MAQLDNDINDLFNELKGYENVICKTCDEVYSKLEYLTHLIPLAEHLKPDYRGQFRKVARRSWATCDILKRYVIEFDSLGLKCQRKIESEKDRTEVITDVASSNN